MKRRFKIEEIADGVWFVKEKRWWGWAFIQVYRNVKEAAELVDTLSWDHGANE